MCLTNLIFLNHSECNEWFRFATINLFQQKKYSTYKKSFEKCCSINTYKILAEALDQVVPNGRHKGKIYCAGSTITADQCHRQMKPLNTIIKKGESIYTTFPRPYKNYVPGQPAHKIIFSKTFYDLFQEIEKIAIEFILRHYMECTRRIKILQYIQECRNIVPPDLRIADTFFTHLTLHGKGELRDKLYTTSYYKHVDPNDIITVIIHLGDVKDGGETVYYKGDEKKPGVAKKIVPHLNGNIQIGCYNKILHAQLPYEGRRCSMILNLKEPIVNYFKKYGSDAYEQYRLMGYPRKFSAY